MKMTRLKDSNGISLVEIPVALVVFGIVIVIAMRIFSTAGRMESDSRFSNQAMAFASAKLTELETLPLKTLTDGEDVVTAKDGFAFTRKWTISQPVAGSDMRTVSIKVNWNSLKPTDYIQVATSLR